MEKRVFSAENKKRILQKLVYDEIQIGSDIDSDQTVDWLRKHALNGLASIRFQHDAPVIAKKLQQDRFLVSAENSIHDELLKRVLKALNAEDINPVLLKGIAMIHGIYGNMAARTMSDIDLWVEDRKMDGAIDALKRAGFYVNDIESSSNPSAIQKLYDGEVQICLPTHPSNLIELQYGPVSGWWQKWTACIDKAAMWDNRIPIAVEELSASQLSSEDAIIQLALHNVVQHQLSMHALRAFVDTAAIVSRRDVNWPHLISKAKEWRVSIVVWLHLYLTDKMIGLPDAKGAIDELTPSFLKKRLLLRIAEPRKLLGTIDLDKTFMRVVFLGILTDRKRDFLKFALKSVWPDQTWLFARYGQKASRRQHFLKLLKSPTS